MVVKRKPTEIRQQQIVDVAQKIIFKYGSEHLTIKRIANEIGISEAAIYRHFENKKAILMFLVSHIEESLLADIDKAVPLGETVTLEVIAQAIQAHFSSINSRKGLVFQVIAEIISLGDKNLNKKTLAMIETYIAKLKGLLQEGVKSNSIRSDVDLDAAALILFSLIQTLVELWAISGCKFSLVDRFDSLWLVYRESIACR